MNDLFVALTLVAVLGCGLSSGALFAFSSFVMSALARLPSPQGIAAMQSINVMAVTPVFMTALLGTGVLCAALGVWALVDWDDTFGPYLLAGSAVYLAGPIGLTMSYHVPRNNALARVDPQSPGGAKLWARYITEWTTLNHVRVAAGVAAAAAFAVSLHVG